MIKKRTFNEKLYDTKSEPEIVILTDPKAIHMYGGTKMLIAPPLEYDAIMKKVPLGQLITVDALKRYLAKKHGADFTCPLTAGIFINLTAKASVERDVDMTPYWRTLKKDGELNEKYPGGIDEQRIKLEAEGHAVIQKGKRFFVQDLADKLYEITE